MKTLFSTIGIKPLCGLVALGTLALTSSHVKAAPTEQVSTVAGKLMLRFKPGASAQDKKRVLAQVKGNLKRTYSTGWALVQLPQSSTDAAIKKLRSLSQVDGAEPDYMWKLEKPLPGTDTSVRLRNNITPSGNIPNDPRYPQQWALQRIGAPEAWKISTGSKDVVVACMDTGVNVSHQDLIPNLFTNTAELNGKAGVDDDNNGFIDDVHGWNSFYSNNNLQDLPGHGTSATGVIGAAGNNGQLISGVNWQVSLLTINVFSEAETISTHSMAEGIDYILALRKQGVNVRAVNCSFGLADNILYRPYFDSFKALNDAGVLIVCAAGNGRLNTEKAKFFPVNLGLPNIISVGASNYADERATSSNYGLNSVDIFAPGESILSTSEISPTTISSVSGTSFAAPMVTGAAALLWASQPNLTATQVKRRILASAKRVEKLRPFVSEGRRLDVGALLNNSIFTIKGKTTFLDDKTRQPLGGVSIFLDDHTGTPDAITDSTGHYAIPTVEGGKHTVRAELSGTTFSAPVTVSFSPYRGAFIGMAIADFEAKSSVKCYALYGHAEQLLLGGKTRPKANAIVYLNDSTVPLARTDAKGNFKVPNLTEGRYAVRLVDTQNGENAATLPVVHLPLTQPKDEGSGRYSPDAYVVVNFDFSDRVAPHIESTNIKKEAIFTPRITPKFFAGTIVDDSAVDSMNIALYRYLPDFSVLETYDGASKKWLNYFTSGLVFAGSVTGNKQSRSPFKFPLPPLEPGYNYEIDTYTYDVFGRETYESFLFQIENSSSPPTKNTSGYPSAGSS